MSPWKPSLYAGAVIILVLLLGVCAGCKKTKMKIPDIKVITTENIHFVAAPDDDNIWIAGNMGIIFHSADGGTTWQEQDSGTRALLADGEFIDARTGWIPGLYGTILHTADGGTTWQNQDSGTDKHLFCISFTDENNGWAIGEWNTILHTTDGGKTWNNQVEEDDRILSNIDMADSQHGWIVGEAGLILHTSDGGVTWERQMPKVFERATFEAEWENPRPSLFGVCALDQNTAFICGLDATIMKTADGGETWESRDTNSYLAIYTIMLKGGRGWAVGDKGAYFISEDNGATWNLLDDVIKSKQWFRDVYFSSPDKGWVVGQSGIVVGTTDGGKTWQFHSGLSYDQEFFEMPKALEFRGLPSWGPFARQ